MPYCVCNSATCSRRPRMHVLSADGTQGAADGAAASTTAEAATAAAPSAAAKAAVGEYKKVADETLAYSFKYPVRGLPERHLHSSHRTDCSTTSFSPVLAYDSDLFTPVPSAPLRQVATDAGRKLSWVPTRGPLAYSAAAPLSPDARQRIVFEVRVGSEACETFPCRDDVNWLLRPPAHVARLLGGFSPARYCDASAYHVLQFIALCSDASRLPTTPDAAVQRNGNLAGCQPEGPAHRHRHRRAAAARARRAPRTAQEQPHPSVCSRFAKPPAFSLPSPVPSRPPSTAESVGAPETWTPKQIAVAVLAGASPSQQPLSIPPRRTHARSRSFNLSHPPIPSHSSPRRPLHGPHHQRPAHLPRQGGVRPQEGHRRRRLRLLGLGHPRLAQRGGLRGGDIPQGDRGDHLPRRVLLHLQHDRERPHLGRGAPARSLRVVCFARRTGPSRLFWERHRSSAEATETDDPAHPPRVPLLASPHRSSRSSSSR